MGFPKSALTNVEPQFVGNFRTVSVISGETNTSLGTPRFLRRESWDELLKGRSHDPNVKMSGFLIIAGKSN